MVQLCELSGRAALLEAEHPQSASQPRFFENDRARFLISAAA